jgi:hypothetical protein
VCGSKWGKSSPNTPLNVPPRLILATGAAVAAGAEVGWAAAGLVAAAGALVTAAGAAVAAAGALGGTVGAAVGAGWAQASNKLPATNKATAR